MIVSFSDLDLTQKQLYFKLNNAFLFHEEISNDATRLSGIYVIYSEQLCLYVGQSKNLASRIATHLKGKYEIDNVSIKIYLPECNGYGEEFYEKSSDLQREILLLNESYFIKKLKPIENIIADHSIDINPLSAFKAIRDDWPPNIEIDKNSLDYVVSSESIDIDHLFNNTNISLTDYIEDYYSVTEYLKSVK